MSIEELNKLIVRKNKGKVAHSEHDLQVSCVNWYRLTYPRHAYLLFAVPNGGWRNTTTAAKLKAEGVLAGVPDLFLAIPHGEFHGLWIEMKNGKAGRVSEAQKEMIPRLREVGYRCEVCHSLLEFRTIIQDYLK